MSVALHVSQQHDLEEVAHMKTARGRIETDVASDPSGKDVAQVGPILFLLRGHLVDKSPLYQFFENPVQCDYASTLIRWMRRSFRNTPWLSSGLIEPSGKLAHWACGHGRTGK
jgi:hypothetical protein